MNVIHRARSRFERHEHVVVVAGDHLIASGWLYRRGYPVNMNSFAFTMG
jgi:hypothetical protein